MNMEEEKNILQPEKQTDQYLHKLQRLLLKLRNSSGQGTSMITLILPPKDQLSRASKLLINEQGTATNIKSRVNRQSVLSAITSANNRLKTLSKVPKNGLAIFSGNILQSTFRTNIMKELVKDKKEKKISFAIEPILPINTSMYMCDSKFHVDSLIEQFTNTTVYGFVIMSGTRCLWAKLQGNTKTILDSQSVDLPKKHGRGGQSSNRFARIRVEKREAYVKKSAELTNNLFKDMDGYILAGPADFKTDLLNSAILSANIKDRVIKVLDTNYGGEIGLKQAISMAEDTLKDVKFNKERSVMNTFFDAVRDNGNYVIGKECLKAIEQGAMETLIVYEDLEMEVEGESILDYIETQAEENDFEIKYVSNKTAEGAQFCEGFGGLAGMCKFKVELDDGEREVVEEELTDDEYFF